MSKVIFWSMMLLSGTYFSAAMAERMAATLY